MSDRSAVTMPDIGLDLLTPREAAGALKSNPRTLERWRTDGAGPPFVKVGRRVAYRRIDLQEWLASRVRRNT
jgi:hypothetical protein